MRSLFLHLPLSCVEATAVNFDSLDVKCCYHILFGCEGVMMLYSYCTVVRSPCCCYWFSF